MLQRKVSIRHYTELDRWLQW